MDREPKKTHRKNSFAKEQVEIADLPKPVSNKLMTTHI